MIRSDFFSLIDLFLDAIADLQFNVYTAHFSIHLVKQHKSTWIYESNEMCKHFVYSSSYLNALLRCRVWELLRYIGNHFAPPSKVAIDITIIIITITYHLPCILCHCLLKLNECVQQTTLIYDWLCSAACQSCFNMNSTNKELCKRNVMLLIPSVVS